MFFVFYLSARFFKSSRARRRRILFCVFECVLCVCFDDGLLCMC